MSEIADNILMIFLKYPQPGAVKTRLAASIGKQKAADIYKAFAEDIIKKTKSENYNQVIFLSPQDKRKEVNEWLGSEIKILPQQGADLGEKLKNAFKYIFDKGAKRVVVIGTDCPAVNEEVVCDAFMKLNEYQSVIGPSQDGGYYLLGLNSYSDDFFDDIMWSSNQVFEQTVNKLRINNLSITILDEQMDIDTKEDLDNWKCVGD